MDIAVRDIKFIYSTISTSKQKEKFNKDMNNFRNRYKK